MFAMTDEQRADARLKLKQSHAAALALPLRREFADDEQWQALASQYDVRLPNWTYPPDVTTMRRWLRRLNIKPREYLEATGLESLEQLPLKNPTWPLRAFVGILLEYVDERDSARKVLTRQPE